MGCAIHRGVAGMKWQVFLVTLFVIPFVAAVDCDKLEYKEWCEDIQNSDLSESEKDYLLSDIFDNLKHFFLDFFKILRRERFGCVKILVEPFF